jgi:hypothetical protein
MLPFDALLDEVLRIASCSSKGSTGLSTGDKDRLYDLLSNMDADSCYLFKRHPKQLKKVVTRGTLLLDVLKSKSANLHLIGFLALRTLSSHMATAITVGQDRTNIMNNTSQVEYQGRV